MPFAAGKIFRRVFHRSNHHKDRLEPIYKGHRVSLRKDFSRALTRCHNRDLFSARAIYAPPYKIVFSAPFALSWSSAPSGPVSSVILLLFRLLWLLLKAHVSPISSKSLFARSSHRYTDPRGHLTCVNHGEDGDRDSQNYPDWRHISNHD